MKNRLLNASSLYLRQHSGNPVHWQPWDEEALQSAANQNRLIIVSIGYAACHWCHVMEHESFGDTEVADLMNRHFVCIKIDREERPDLDQQYMTAIQLLNGQGGWPLNCIALPDGRPVFGGTYFRRADWMTLLGQLNELWQKNPAAMERQASDIRRGVKESDYISGDAGVEEILPGDTDIIAERINSRIDTVYGGLKGAPRFPMVPLATFMLMAGMEVSYTQLSSSVFTMLRKMHQGGIYDHLGGGFSRYSVDAGWRVPHFEKMLYDNAQLAGLYAQAFAETGDELFREVSYGILHFLRCELKSDEGGYYGSVDADSEEEEGRFYTWESSEISSLLGEDADLFLRYYNCRSGGNFEQGRNILHPLQTDDEFWATESLDKGIGYKMLKSSREILLKEREKRIRPQTDTKCITAWNALLVSGLVEMYKAFQDDSLLIEAQFLMKEILQKAKRSTDPGLNHLFGLHDTLVPGFLDDYAQVSFALTDLYSVTFHQDYLEEAENLVVYAMDHFSDPESGLFFFISKEESYPVARKTEIHDHVTPSSNAVLAETLLRLSFYRSEISYEARSRLMLSAIKPSLVSNPVSFGWWARVALLLTHQPWQVTLYGNKAREWGLELVKESLPSILIRIAVENEHDDSNSAESFMVPCRGKVCYEPVRDPGSLRALIKGEAERR